MIVLDHGQPTREMRDGIEIHCHTGYRSPHRWDGSDAPRSLSDVLRRDGGRIVLPRGAAAAFLHGPILALKGAARRIWRAPGGQSAYAAARPDAICVMGVSPLAVEVAEYARRAGARTVLMLGSDEDLSEKYYPGSRELNAYGSPGDLCYRAITGFDAIVTQTESQRALLEERFHRQGTTIRNPIEIEAPQPREAAREVLWIGKSDGVKRPEHFVRLARELPLLRFTMVMNVSDRELFQRVAASLPENVRLIERVPFRESAGLFARAAVLVNTSRFEGFPNAFLQAAAAGVPIASLSVDPDGMLARAGCGVVAANDSRVLREVVNRFCGDPAFARKFGDKGREYVRAYHAAEERAAELGNLLEMLCRR
jgi:glycosyltransferase involved in cell wall biosynthesis